jgi:Protein of unknown function (DUF3048).
MKRIVCMVLAAVLLLSTMVGALAETQLVKQKDRKVKIQLKKDSKGNYPVNPEIPGESMTTGLPWDGYYMPMLVQIDNHEGGIGAFAPWGASYADIVYETPLHRQGHTRISFLFSDEMPESVGPVRSARVGHVWLREEWDAGFIFFGGSEVKGANINDEFRKFKTSAKGVLFSGMVSESKPWKPLMPRVSGKASPHNVNSNVMAIQALVPAEHTPPRRPFLFTDELPSTGDFANKITLKWTHPSFVSSFVYDDTNNVYLRYVTDQPYLDEQVDEQLAFSNVIIQRVPLKFLASDQPVTSNDKGSGNADIFIGGRYIPGYWVRTAVEERTIFFDDKGNELQLQRGKTYIAMMPSDFEVDYE